MPVTVSIAQKEVIIAHLDDKPMKYGARLDAQAFGFEPGFQVLYYPAGSCLLSDTPWLGSDDDAPATAEETVLSYYLEQPWHSVVGVDKVLGPDGVITEGTYTFDNKTIEFNHKIKLTPPRICVGAFADKVATAGAMGSVSYVYEITPTTPVDEALQSERLCKTISLTGKGAGEAACLEHALHNETEMLQRLTNSSMGFWGEGDNQDEYYLDIEKMPGRALDELLKETFLTHSQRIDLSVAIINAVNDLHEQHGVLHRDLKPPHFFVEETADGYSVRLIDFGFSAVITDVTEILEESIVVGSPTYMAPETTHPTARNTYRYSCDSDKYAVVGTIAKVLGASNILASKLPFRQNLIKFSEQPYSFEGVLSGAAEPVVNRVMTMLARASSPDCDTRADISLADLMAELLAVKAELMPVPAAVVDGDEAINEGWIDDATVFDEAKAAAAAQHDSISWSLADLSLDAMFGKAERDAQWLQRQGPANTAPSWWSSWGALWGASKRPASLLARDPALSAVDEAGPGEAPLTSPLDDSLVVMKVSQ